MLVIPIIYRKKKKRRNYFPIYVNKQEIKILVFKQKDRVSNSANSLKKLETTALIIVA